jgi:hypothetical protein
MSDTRYLLSQAERCFRLAGGSAGPRLADKLEALGRALALEALELEFAKEGGTGISRRHRLGVVGARQGWRRVSPSAQLSRRRCLD